MGYPITPPSSVGLSALLGGSSEGPLLRAEPVGADGAPTSTLRYTRPLQFGVGGVVSTATQRRLSSLCCLNFLSHVMRQRDMLSRKIYLRSRKIYLRSRKIYLRSRKIYLLSRC